MTTNIIVGLLGIFTAIITLFALFVIFFSVAWARQRTAELEIALMRKEDELKQIVEEYVSALEGARAEIDMATERVEVVRDEYRNRWLSATRGLRDIHDIPAPFDLGDYS